MKFAGQNLNSSKKRVRILNSLEHRLNTLLSNFSIRFTIEDLRNPGGFHVLKERLNKESLKMLVVDIGASVDEFESSYYEMFDGFESLQIIGFDPLIDKNPSGGNISIHPFLIGNGRAGVFHTFNDFRCSSLLDLNYEFCSTFNHISELKILETENVLTHKLDDVLKVDHVSLLKIDVQGAELMVLQGAEEILKKRSAVILEVEFSAIYSNQPLFSDILNHLSGFEFVDFLDSRRYNKLNSLNLTTSNQLLWSDALFVNKAADKENYLQISAVCFSLAKYSMASYYLDLANEI